MGETLESPYTLQVFESGKLNQSEEVLEARKYTGFQRQVSKAQTILFQQDKSENILTELFLKDLDRISDILWARFVYGLDSTEKQKPTRLNSALLI